MSNSSCWRMCWVLALILCGLFPAVLIALPLDPSGDPDLTFDSDGFNTTNFNLVNTFAEGRGVAIQQLGANAGKIVVGGNYQEGFNDHLAVIRINTDGTLDGSFGNGGRVQNPVATFELGNDIAIQSDDKIVQVGLSSTTTQDMVIARYTPDGALDTSFAGTGYLNFEVAPGQFDRGHAVTIQSDGKIIVVGYCGDSTDATGRDFCIARFNTNGTFDTSFDGPSGTGDGRVRIAVSPGNAQDRAWDVRVQPDGKIVVGGDSRPAGNADFAIIRLNTNGTLDSSFGTGGIATADMSTVGSRFDSLRGIELQADGKIVAVGSGVFSQDGSFNDKISIAVARFTAAGVLDTSFSGDGKVSRIITTGFLSDQAEDVRIQADGKIVVGAYTDTGSGANFAMLRYNSDGTEDNSYDGDGLRILDFGGDDNIDAIALDSAGRAVCVGYRSITSGGPRPDTYIAAARLTTAGIPDTTFNTTGSLFTQLQGGSVESASGLAIQSVGGNAGKAIVVGTTDTGTTYSFGIARYTTAGALDTSFDGDGKATIGTASSESARGVLVQPDDKIVVVGDSLSTPPNLTVARLNANGGADTSFSGDGIAQVSLGTNASSGFAVARQSDGKLVVAGTASNTASEWNFAVVRFNTDGSLDNTFDADGSRIINIAAGQVDTAQALVIQPDGKILLGGYAFTAGNSSDFALLRLNADGSNDNSFDTDGIVRTAFSANTFSRSEIRSLALLPDGRILAAGKHNDGLGSSNNVMAIARYNANGSLDTTFDGDGRKTVNFAADRFDEAYALALQFDEKPVLFGSSQQLFVTNFDFALTRLNWDDGSLDTTYGNNGFVVQALSSAADQAQAGLLLAGGKQLAAGTALGSDFGVARYLSDPAPTPAGTPVLDAASDTGRSSTDNITMDNTPTISGSCVVGETAILKVNGVDTTPTRTRQLCRTGTYTFTLPTLADGVYAFSAQEINGNGAAAVSGALSVTIDTVAAAPSISAPTNGAVLTVPPSPTISGVGAEGDADVDVRVGAAIQCTDRADAAPANNAAWSCLSTLGPGAQTITARQTDIAGNVSVNSAAVSFTGKTQTTAMIASNVNPSVYGQSVTFTATVDTVPSAYAVPTGSVDFVIDSVTVATVALTGGVATYSTNSLTAGAAHTVAVVYPDQTGFFGSSATLSGGQTVNPASTVVSVISTANPSVFGQAISFNASVAAVAPGGLTPDGLVSFVVDGGAPQVVALVAGSASLPAGALAVGNHTVAVNYGGTGNYLASSGALAGSQIVNRANAVATVVSAPNPSALGSSATFTATVTALAPGAGTPGGNVTVTIDGTPRLLTLAAGSASFSESTLSGGNHAVSVSYAGDANFNIAAGSLAGGHDVNRGNVVVDVQTATSPTVFGQNAAFSVNVSAQAPASSIPSGSVEFVIDGGAPQAVLLSSGSATLNSASLAVGAHTVVANYLGDIDFNTGSGSLAGGQTVNQAASVTTLVSSAPSTRYGETVTFTANVGSVAPGTGVPDGSVEFVIDGGAPVAVALTAGQSMLARSDLSVGTHTVAVTYTGSTNFLTSTATLAGGHQVIRSDTTLSVASSLNPSTLGDTVNFVATIGALAPGAGTPSGSIEFVVDSGAAQSMPIVAGSATLSTASLTVGTHTLSISYAGDVQFNANTALLSGGQVVQRAGAAINLASSGSPSVFGQTVTFTSTVTALPPATGTPTGEVEFVVDGVALSPRVILVGGSASVDLSTLASGTHAIDANYLGDADFGAATTSQSQQVNAANTQTSVVSSVNPSAFGQNIDFTATVATQAPGAGVAGGTVEFVIDGGTPQPVTLVAGSAILSTSTLGAGSHSITANYLGGADFAASNGVLPSGQQVNAAATAVSVTSSANPIVVGQSVTISATVSVNPPGAGTPTGSVDFVIDGGAAQPVTLAGGGASLVVPGLAIGTHTVDVNFAGSPEYAAANGSLAGGQLVIAGEPASIVLIAGNAQSTTVDSDFATVIEVEVRDPDGYPVPNVAVQFLAPDSGASASFTLPIPPASGTVAGGANPFDAITGTDGRARVMARANTVAGNYSVSLSAGSAANILNLTNLSGAAASLFIVSGDPQSTLVTHAFAAPLRVGLIDGFGNPVPDSDVVFAAPIAGASANLSAMTVSTDAQGLAEVSAIANAAVGSYQVSATTNGVAGVNFALTNLAPVPLPAIGNTAISVMILLFMVMALTRLRSRAEDEKR